MVAFLDGFCLPESSGRDFIQEAYLCNLKTGKLFDSGFGFIYLELKKFSKTESELETDLDRWLFVLKNMARLKEVPLVLRNTIWEKVFKIGKYSNLNKEDQMAYDVSLKRRWDDFNTHETAFVNGEEKGEIKGKKIGAENAKKLIARNLKKEGLSLDVIAQATLLPKEVVEKL